MACGVEVNEENETAFVVLSMDDDIALHILFQQL
jgi:hypothetical protein